jgi:hypothetical protein
MQLSVNSQFSVASRSRKYQLSKAPPKSLDVVLTIASIGTAHRLSRLAASHVANPNLMTPITGCGVVRQLLMLTERDPNSLFGGEGEIDSGHRGFARRRQIGSASKIAPGDFVELTVWRRG